MPVKFLILITGLLTPLIGWCQDQSLKVNFGLNRTNVILNPQDIFSTEDRFKTGYVGELIFTRKISSPLYLGGGVGLIQKGYRAEVILTDLNGENLGTSNTKHVFNYLNFSLHAGAETNGDIYLVSDIAIIPSLLMHSEVRSDLPGVGGDVTDRIDKFDLSAQFLLGLGKHVNEKMAFELNLAYRQSLRQSEFGNIVVAGGGDNKYSHIAVVLNFGMTYNL